MRDKKVSTVCEVCGGEHEMKVDKKDYTDWKQGKLIQVAMPYLEPSERELLITGICGDCFLDFVAGG